MEWIAAKKASILEFKALEDKKAKGEEHAKIGESKNGRRERTLKGLCTRPRSSLQADGRIENYGFILAKGVYVGRDHRRDRRGAERVSGGDGAPAGDRRERSRHWGRYTRRHPRSWSPSFAPYLETNK